MLTKSGKLLTLSVSLLILTGMVSSLIYYLNLYPEKKRPKHSPHYWKIKSPETYFIERLTLEEKIGQLLIIGFSPAAMKNMPEKFKTFKYGGIILYKRNIGDLNDLYELTTELKKMNSKNPLPLFIGIDEEGGSVSRLPDSATKFPDARLVGRVNDQDLTYQIGRVMGSELYALGINMNFAPVLDIQTNPVNYFLSRRVFGTDSERVTRHGVFMIRGMRAENVLAVAKHFPGHGDSDADSHGRLPVILIDRKKMLERETAPYRYAAWDGLDAVMVGHIAFPRIDTTGAPATLSRVILNGILRDELKFDGLAISDEIEMQAYMKFHDSLEQSLIQSFNAGIDMFIVGHTAAVQDRVFRILYNAALSGQISRERLDQSLARILRKKLKYNIKHQHSVTTDEMLQTVGSEEHHRVLETIFHHKKNL